MRQPQQDYFRRMAKLERQVERLSLRLSQMQKGKTFILVGEFDTTLTVPAFTVPHDAIIVSVAHKMHVGTATVDLYVEGFLYQSFNLSTTYTEESLGANTPEIYRGNTVEIQISAASDDAEGLTFTTNMAL